MRPTGFVAAVLLALAACSKGDSDQTEQKAKQGAVRKVAEAMAAKWNADTTWPQRLSAIRLNTRPMIDAVFPIGRVIVVVGTMYDIGRTNTGIDIDIEVGLAQPGGRFVGGPVEVIADCGGEFGAEVLRRETEGPRRDPPQLAMAIAVQQVDLVRKDMVVDGNSEEERRIVITGACSEGRILGQNG